MIYESHSSHSKFNRVIVNTIGGLALTVEGLISLGHPHQAQAAPRTLMCQPEHTVRPGETIDSIKAKEGWTYVDYTRSNLHDPNYIQPNWIVYGNCPLPSNGYKVTYPQPGHETPGDYVIPGGFAVLSAAGLVLRVFQEQKKGK